MGELIDGLPVIPGVVMSGILWIVYARMCITRAR